MVQIAVEGIAHADEDPAGCHLVLLDEAFAHVEFTWSCAHFASHEAEEPGKDLHDVRPLRSAEVLALHLHLFLHLFLHRSIVRGAHEVVDLDVPLQKTISAFVGLGLKSL